MFSKILIANRGEIACRVIKTARRLGVRTVAVYSDADRDARHVAMADEAVHIGPSPARESYLVADRLIAAAQATGAEGIHPGYGFLSENAGFADACAAAGIVFIGPPPSAIRAMGSKSEAKKLMEAAKVPLVPGYHGDDQSPELLAREADRIGYPVLIKASAGGGGKGMRVVESAAKFAEALAGAKREAKAAFADDHVLVEKYLTRPRHIEVQVFGDTHGHCLYLFERDCSIQRRHQKVIEEAPAPGMTVERRKAMGEAAVAAARAIGYVGAGTVEFIADESGDFYFMEMNTRLQVEHPVTEMITGQDLVEWQLRVACGEAMPLTQDQLAIDGHAFEVRLYAEDPSRNFLPSVGTLKHLALPRRGSGARVDTGVRQGDAVTPYYDPMIAKIIVHGPDRAAALRRLQRALAETEVVGVRTNTALLARIAAHPAFAAGEVDTGFIERHKAVVLPKAEAADTRVLALATLARLLEWRRDAADRAAASAEPTSPWHSVDGWRLNGAGRDEVRWKDAERDVPVMVHYRRGAAGSAAGAYAVDCRIEIGNAVLDAGATLARDGSFRATLGEAVTSARVVRNVANDGGVDYVVFADGSVGGRTLRLVDPRDVSAAEAAGAPGGGLKAPMPGKIIDFKVKAGESVSRGQPVVVLEAMKMEHTLVAPSDGTVKRLLYAPGDQVPDGADLVEFEAAE
ncbi:acetyl/propionyl/methylcrotonyl-CoA carboxylase subunit alpha [Reyranella sp. CPCC 100927]|uniref:acetyl/propionyl/methylcrotonyl-CoA carboxylase subunit alpha n=1 Tax=Reyranella sp. CPCC 100927 TaxID=2599616 RepID=UPI0011B542F2|nr:acetyl/propionyl/methylcrotonyl-CoA carboxylase subunit alpha [Reyranella sp. CPCC 100927]TWS98459.1 acetyl/propionyl/methylcrotonyl-CoA carboxylase subunit alpha [Reyranella sp. CPCC 100927]